MCNLKKSIIQLSWITVHTWAKHVDSEQFIINLITLTDNFAFNRGITNQYTWWHLYGTFMSHEHSGDLEIMLLGSMYTQKNIVMVQCTIRIKATCLSKPNSGAVRPLKF